MIRQAHRSTALSLLLAAVATMLLYQPEAPTPAPVVADSPETPQPIVAQDVPELTPAAPWTEPSAQPDRATRVPPAPTGLAPGTAARANPIVPRKAFTTVATGERLADVARRVYGSTDAADRLWQANRDTLPTRDAPLEPGTLLRTP